MGNCKCGKELLDGEKKCERCIRKEKEALKKIGAALVAGVALVGSQAIIPALKKVIKK